MHMYLQEEYDLLTEQLRKTQEQLGDVIADRDYYKEQYDRAFQAQSKLLRENTSTATPSGLHAHSAVRSTAENSYSAQALATAPLAVPPILANITILHN